MPGRSAKRKGSRIEREIVHLHREAGIPAKRVPLSGAVGGTYAGDVVIAGKFTAEVKARKSGAGFKTIKNWLGDNDMLFLREDNARPLVLMPWDTYLGWREMDTKVVQQLRKGIKKLRARIYDNQDLGAGLYVVTQVLLVQLLSDLLAGEGAPDG